MNVSARLEFELTYNNAAVQNVSHYTIGTSHQEKVELQFIMTWDLIRKKKIITKHLFYN